MQKSFVFALFAFYFGFAQYKSAVFSVKLLLTRVYQQEQQTGKAAEIALRQNNLRRQTGLVEWR